jgi:hypothetical protein
VRTNTENKEKKGFKGNASAKEKILGTGKFVEIRSKIILELETFLNLCGVYDMFQHFSGIPYYLLPKQHNVQLDDGFFFWNC